MAVKFGQDEGSNQMRWVILLLCLAVILPTVCLLWFMAQAVKNERLAVRQKLIDVYSESAQHFFVEVPNSYVPGVFIKPVEVQSKSMLYRNELSAIFELFAAGPDSSFDGMLIYDSNGSVAYPVLDSVVIGEPDELLEPLQQELRGNLKKAVELYEEKAQTAQTDKVLYNALLSEARCLDKLGRRQEAVEILDELSRPKNHAALDPQAAVIVMRSRIYLAEIYSRTGDDRLYEYIRRILGNRGNAKQEEISYIASGPVDTIIWQLNKLIDIARRSGLDDRLASEIGYAQEAIAAYRSSAEAADVYPDADKLNLWPDRTIRKISPDSNLYGLKFRLGDKTFLGLRSADRILEVLAAAVKDVQDDTVAVQVYDNYGQVIEGDKNLTGKPFLTLQPGEFFPDFEVAVYFRGNSVFEDAAGRQAAVYIWAGLLVVILILASGAIAAQAVGRQIKLNRLKNVFIATVTHELKTPLSSMRVLVDTLLEGSYEGEQTVNEYLRLISRENERLSHLIDNFLTFSRMERNKQAFEISAVSPVEIANAAADAVRAKFDMNNVRFNVTMDKPLPMIRADKDAMVTVLVNLLDNAYKYSGDDKRIELRVYSGNGSVCFCVKDNGIGMTRRQLRKAFDRFYQADSSLARRAEGAGLGLSIVKFIVDAHNGKITVESKPEKGSKFTVKLKALAGNGNHINN
jgi:signal transduction histidine kinase